MTLSASAATVATIGTTAFTIPRRGRVHRSLPPYGTGDVCLRLLGRQHAVLHVTYGAIADL